jgi:hypothetical protein
MSGFKFRPRNVRNFISQYLSLQFETEDGRLSPLTASLIVTCVSIALWALIVDLVARLT